MIRLVGRIVLVLLSGVLVLAAVAWIRDPVFWKRYAAYAIQGGRDLTLSAYEPRERVEGGSIPPAPRVAPDLELLNASSMVEASHYAGDHGASAFIVTRHGHIVFERYWDGSGFDTLRDSHTMARTLAVLLVGVAIGERKIGWADEPILNFIPQWRNDPRGQITVRELMQQSSGLATTGSPMNPWSAAAHARFGGDVQGVALKSVLAGKPGETWMSQSPDIQLLALVIERATHQRYSDYLSVELWRKLGAADAWLWLDRAGGAPHADCCFLARQGDWIRLGELLASDGRYQGDEIVPPGWIAQLLRPARGNPSWGAGVRLDSKGSAAETYALKDVFLVESPGERLWLVPSMGLVILRVGREIPTGSTGSSWDDARIPNLIIRGARDYVPQQAQPGANLRDIVPNH